MFDAIAIQPVAVTDAVLTSTDAVEGASAWAAGTIYLEGDLVRSDATHRVYESTRGQVVGTNNMTPGSPGTINKNSHGLAEGTEVAFTTTGNLSPGLTPLTIYYVRNPTADTFNVSLTPTGALINTTAGQTGVHTLYAEPNLGFDPTLAANQVSEADPAAPWIDTRPTNDRAMFDALNGTKTVRADSLTVVLEPGVRTDALGLQGLRGTSATITVSDGVDTLFEQTYPLIVPEAVTGWWSWWFEERVQRDTLVVPGLPPVPAPVITVTVAGAGADVEVGTLAIGRALVLGTAEKGFALDFKDYSYWNENAFGIDEVVLRGFKRQLDARLLVDNARIGFVNNKLLALRGVPLFWAFTDAISAGSAFGFFKRLSAVVEYPNHSLMALSILGTIEDN